MEAPPVTQSYQSQSDDQYLSNQKCGNAMYKAQQVHKHYLNIIPLALKFGLFEGVVWGTIDSHLSLALSLVKQTGVPTESNAM